MHDAHSYTANQTKTLEVAAFITCSLSLVGIIYVLAHYICKRCRKQTAVDFTSTLVFVLSWLDFATILGRIFGRTALETRSPEPNALCLMQAMVLEFTGLAGTIWICCMAFNLYRWMVCGDSERRRQARFLPFLIVTMTPSLILTVYDLLADKYGDAGLFCWLKHNQDRFVQYYLAYLSAMVFQIVLLVLVRINVKRRRVRAETMEANIASSIIQRKLVLYILVFMAHRLPAMIYRCFNAKRFLPTLLVQSVLNLEGFANSMVYGGLFLSRVDRKKLTITTSEDQQDDADHHFIRMPSPSPAKSKSLPLFVSTFNMAEQNIRPHELSQWIPRGFEIYVLGVQECMDLEHFRSNVTSHLAQLNHKTFVSFSREIGNRTTALGYHGFIAIVVFVDEKAITNGHFEMPTTPQTLHRGKSLVVFGRTANKGAVGLSFRYQNASFAFVTCHLASDASRKKTCRSKCTRRNQDAQAILQHLYLDQDEYGFGFPALHHYSFVLGDLNYRMTRQSAKPRELVGLLGQSGDKMSLLDDHDELQALMQESQVFYGFQEPPIAFYPTFRRVRGASIAPPHDEMELERNYTLQVSSGGDRVPSYTDRILYTTLPGTQYKVFCRSYDSCEAVTTSDHKPVCAVFECLVEEEPASDTKELTLILEFMAMEWITEPPLSLEDAEVGILFPLPSEDAFAQHRKLQQVAQSLLGGSQTNKPSRETTNFHIIKWKSFVQTTTRLHTRSKSTGQKHVAILIRLPPPLALTTTSTPASAVETNRRNANDSFAEVKSRSSSSALSTSGNPLRPVDRMLGQGSFLVQEDHEHQSVMVPMTLGGKLVGHLQLRVVLCCR